MGVLTWDERCLLFCACARELRSLSGASLQLSGYPDVPACVKKGEEVRWLVTRLAEAHSSFACSQVGLVQPCVQLVLS
jgi:hypothetical protein